MTPVLHRLRKYLLIFLLFSCLAWIVGEAAQRILRNRATRLLADIQALTVNRSTWSDVQPIMARWGSWNVSKGPCASDACTYQIDLMQTLPVELIGSPQPGARNWVPRLIDCIGLRSVAVRAGFTIDHGILVTKWFGEQVTLPVRNWDHPDGYVPYLSVASTETIRFSERAKGNKLLHPNRMVQRAGTYIDVAFSPDEESSEQTALMSFRLSCITRFRPCTSEGEILPEALHMWHERELTLPSR